jgi:hypothetical protein
MSSYFEGVTHIKIKNMMGSQNTYGINKSKKANVENPR